MHSSTPRNELVSIIETAACLSASVPSFVHQYQSLREDLKRSQGLAERYADDEPNNEVFDVAGRGLQADIDGVLLRVRSLDGEIQRLWAAVTIELPELAVKLEHAGKPGPWRPDDLSIDWSAVVKEWRTIEVAARRKLASGGADLPALSSAAAAVLELLLALPSYRGLTGPKILDELSARKPPIHIDQSTLTKRVIPKLRPYGITNQPKIGYRIPESKRHSHDAPAMRP